MNDKNRIHKELVRFKRKFWLAKLIQGSLIFIGSGIAVVLIAVGIEYLAWLEPLQREILAILTVVIELVLVAYYMLWPLFQIILGGPALSNKQAAGMIKKVVSGVNDVLENYLELQDFEEASALIQASLIQKEQKLSGFNFLKAVKWASLKPFLAFLLVPILLFSFLLTNKGREAILEGSHRLLNYTEVFEKSLPFEIQVEGGLTVEEGEDLFLIVQTIGKVSPEKLLISSAFGTQELERVSPNVFKKVFRNCNTDLEFHFIYDDIRSKPFTITVQKRPVLGRVHIKISPPTYTGIKPYELDNSRVVQVPEGSDLSINYVFKNLELLRLETQDSKTDESYLRSGESIKMTVKRNKSILAFADKKLLNRTEIEVVKDLAPILDVRVDSSAEGLIFVINANDDYKIIKANAYILYNTQEEESLSFSFGHSILKTALFYSHEQIHRMEKIKIVVSDVKQQRTFEVDLAKFKQQEQTTEELLSEAGESIEKLIEESKEVLDNSEKKNITSQKEDQKKEKAKQLHQTIEKLTKKDTAQFERFEQLSEEINKLLEKMDKEISKSEKEILDHKLDEQIEMLELEWMILKAIDQLKQLDDSLDIKPFVDEKQMQNIQEAAKDLKEKLDQEKKEKVTWKKYDDLKDLNDSQKPNSDMHNSENPEEKEDSSGDQDEKNERDGENSKRDKQSTPKEQMQEDSDALKKELSSISASMMMETMQKNIELLRRLEMRSLKASNKQEEVYLSTINQNEYNRSLVLAQKEITQSARNVLDSLSALLITDPMLSQVLAENKNLLIDHISEMDNLAEMSQPNRVSSQRYLQYSLNDLASTLYDILKSESESMQNMMAGNKQCNKPKPGKGEKGSMSKKQRELGEKMGNMKKQGKGKSGKQTMGQGELLELIKGQEEIISQYKQKGGSKAGDEVVLQELNRQLDDLINSNLEKAIERNKSIEEKLIAIEQSENEKQEKKEERKSKENEIDYLLLKETALSDYLRNQQKSSGVVNLPALKNYFTGKWIQINQE